jgi:sulfide:quinone oxidoreductase
VVILGAGTGGTVMAHKLSQELDDSWTITVVDQDDVHLYKPGLLLLPFGTYRKEQLVKPRRRLLPSRVEVRLGRVVSIEPDERRIGFEEASPLEYDLLIVATGSHTYPELTEGLTGHGWHETMTDFYTLEGSQRLRELLAGFEGGRIVVNPVDMPITCPVAPLEFAFLADAHLRERGLRDKTEIVYATPLDSAFTKPQAAAALGGLLDRKNIKLEASFNAASADGERQVLTGYDGRELPFDLLVSIPLHGGAPFLKGNPLTDPLGWVKVDPHTLQSVTHENVFAIGDGTNVPTSKAGSAAHFMAETVTDNVLRFTRGQAPVGSFDGHANCFVETGDGKGLLIDFNYDTEPLRGRFPLPGVGPFTLLEESAANHWGKLGFKWVYWNLLLPGKPLPIDDQMTHAGKWAA